jgi:hypothetical protein
MPGRIPFVLHLLTSNNIGGSEVHQIQMTPTFRFDDVGASLLTMRVIGDMTGISAGKSCTIRFHSCSTTSLSLGSDAVLGTIVVNANGLFSASCSFAPPAGKRVIYISYETDSTNTVTIKGMLWIVEPTIDTAGKALGLYFHRSTNSNFTGSNGAGGEGIGNYQAFVDFDMLGPEFWVQFGGGLASSGLGDQAWKLRVGGTYDVLDGTVSLNQTSPPTSAFDLLSVKQLVSNPFSGVQLIKLTGQSIAGGAALAVCPSLLIWSPAAKIDGALPIFHQTGATPVGLTGDSVEHQLGEACYIIDPTLLPNTHPKIRIGGRLTGSGGVVLKLRTGGSHATADGTLIATSPTFSPTLTPFVWELDETELGTIPLRVKLSYEATGSPSIADFYFFPYCPTPIVVEPRGGLPPTDPRSDVLFGTDIDVTTDLPTSFVLAAGLQNLANAIVRRLGTPAGALAAFGDDENYGYDLRSKLNRGMSLVAIRAVNGEIEAEVLRDERIFKAEVATDFNLATNLFAVDIALETALGPFRLILAVSDRTVTLINAAA